MLKLLSPGGATVHDACICRAAAVVGVGTEGLPEGLHVDERGLPHGSVLEPDPRPRAACRVPAVGGRRPAHAGDRHRPQELLQEPLHGRHGDGKETERRRLDGAQLAVPRQRLSHLTSRSQTVRLEHLRSTTTSKLLTDRRRVTSHIP